MEASYICSSCGHNVLDDGCNYRWEHGVVECSHCEERRAVPAEAQAILNEAELSKEQINEV